MGSGRVSLPQKGTKNVPQIGTPYPSKLVCLISSKNGSGRVSSNESQNRDARPPGKNGSGRVSLPQKGTKKVDAQVP